MASSNMEPGARRPNDVTEAAIMFELINAQLVRANYLLLSRRNMRVTFDHFHSFMHAAQILCSQEYCVRVCVYLRLARTLAASRSEAGPKVGRRYLIDGRPVFLLVVPNSLFANDGFA